jgi:hypothetical protein
MPGPEHPAAHARVARSVMPDGPELSPSQRAAPVTDRAAGDDGQPPDFLAPRLNRPAVPGLIALTGALAFALARW